MSYVYFICDDKTRRAKIGFSSDPKARLAILQTGASSQLRLLGYVTGSRRCEATIHYLLSEWRVGGEWFDYKYPVTDFIATALYQGISAATAKYEGLKHEKDHLCSEAAAKEPVTPKNFKAIAYAVVPLSVDSCGSSIELLTNLFVDYGFEYDVATSAAIAADQVLFNYNWFDKLLKMKARKSELTP